jgi:hypothetical protein
LQPFVPLTGTQDLADIVLELDESVIVGGTVVRELETVTPAQDATPSEVTPDEMILNKVTIWY